MAKPYAARPHTIVSAQGKAKSEVDGAEKAQVWGVDWGQRKAASRVRMRTNNAIRKAADFATDCVSVAQQQTPLSNHQSPPTTLASQGYAVCRERHTTTSSPDKTTLTIMHSDFHNQQTQVASEKRLEIRPSSFHPPSSSHQDDAGLTAGDALIDQVPQGYDPVRVGSPLRKWWVLWWHMTFAPYIWKEIPKTLVWGKEAVLERLTRRAVEAQEELMCQSATRNGLSDATLERLRQPFPRGESLVDRDPSYSIRRLLEDNVILQDNPRQTRMSGGMTEVGGWKKRCSTLIDGHRTFTPKSQILKMTEVTGTRHKGLELRAAHNRKKLLDLALQEHIFNVSVAGKRDEDHAFGLGSDNTLLKSDALSLRLSQPDQSYTLRDGTEGGTHQRCGELKGLHVDVGAVGGGEVPAMLLEKEELERKLKENTKLKANKDRLKAQARLLQRYERAALDAEAALHQKQEELSGCWQAYLGAAGALPARRSALEGIECALNGSYGLQKTAEAARKMYTECLEMAREYEQNDRKAANVIIRFFQHFVLGVVPLRSTTTESNPIQGDGQSRGCRPNILDIIMSTEAKKEIQREKILKMQQAESKKMVLNLSLTEKSETEKRWTKLSRGIVHEMDLRALVEISFASVSKFIVQAMEGWTMGKLELSRRCLGSAQDTRRRALEYCVQVVNERARSALMGQDEERQDALHNLELYLAQACRASSSVTSTSESILFPSCEAEYGEIGAGLHRNTLAEQVETQKRQHLGLRPDRLLAHAMQEDAEERLLRSFRQELRF